MKNLFFVFFLLLLGVPRITIGQGMGVGNEWGYKGLAGAVIISKGHGGGGVPYAQIYFIDGKDTVGLTCDVLGFYHWKTSKIPFSFWVCAMGLGFKTSYRKYIASNTHYANYVQMSLVAEEEELNRVIIFSDKVQMVIRGDTIVHKVSNAFKNLDGDWAGDLLRKLPGVSTANGVLTVYGVPIHTVNVKKEGLKYAIIDIFLEQLRKEYKLQKKMWKNEEKN